MKKSTIFIMAYFLALLPYNPLVFAQIAFAKRPAVQYYNNSWGGLGINKKTTRRRE